MIALQFPRHLYHPVRIHPGGRLITEVPGLAGSFSVEPSVVASVRKGRALIGNHIQMFQLIRIRVGLVIVERVGRQQNRFLVSPPNSIRVQACAGGIRQGHDRLIQSFQRCFPDAPADAAAQDLMCHGVSLAKSAEHHLVYLAFGRMHRMSFLPLPVKGLLLLKTLANLVCAPRKQFVREGPGYLILVLERQQNDCGIVQSELCVVNRCAHVVPASKLLR